MSQALKTDACDGNRPMCCISFPNKIIKLNLAAPVVNISKELFLFVNVISLFSCVVCPSHYGRVRVHYDKYVIVDVL